MDFLSDCDLLLAVADYLGALNPDAISEERKSVLNQAVEPCRQDGFASALNFICTHNSRRSHFGHVWAQVTAAACGLGSLRTYSGGTEATACNERTVAALRRVGFDVNQGENPTDAANPIYSLKYASDRPSIELYSKVYDAAPNPSDDYIAMMCCADVDERCPVVRGAKARVSLHYLDPKSSDDSPQESITYDARCRQIAEEMLFLMQTLAKLAG